MRDKNSSYIGNVITENWNRYTLESVFGACQHAKNSRKHIHSSYFNPNDSCGLINESKSETIRLLEEPFKIFLHLPINTMYPLVCVQLKMKSYIWDGIRIMIPFSYSGELYPQVI